MQLPRTPIFRGAHLDACPASLPLAEVAADSSLPAWTASRMLADGMRFVILGSGSSGNGRWILFNDEKVAHQEDGLHGSGIQQGYLYVLQSRSQ